jgi:hypothetical protein
MVCELRKVEKEARVSVFKSYLLFGIFLQKLGKAARNVSHSSWLSRLEAGTFMK